jgi:hypothetical protein
LPVGVDAMRRGLGAAIAASAALVAVAVAVMPTVVLGQGRERSFAAALTGFQETPSIITNARGSFSASVEGDSSIKYRLSYSGFATQVMVAHIHVGQRGVAGAIAVFLCGGGGKPTCPSPAGTVTGTITPADVLAIPAQGLDAGSFPELLRAVRAGVTYANVHSAAHPAGEIRGQIGSELDIRQDQAAED